MPMMTLIKYYDKDVLKNIMAPLTIKPDRIVFLYDKEIRDYSYFYGLKKCFQRHMPHIILEKSSVDILDMEDISKKTCAILEQESQYCMDLTGGSELMMIAGYKVAMENDVCLYYTDLINGSIINLKDNSYVMNTTSLTLEDFVEARGASFMGNSHAEPKVERYNDILKMCMILFDNLQQWKKTCSYLQIVTARVPHHELHIESRMGTSQKNGRKVSPNRELLYAFEAFGFLKNLKMTKDRIQFTYSSLESKQYMINYGVWLELYVFIAAKKTGAFNDVELGMMIDWNAYDGSTVAGNEIDVVLSDRSLPVFISCKLRQADTAALNELVVAKKRVGGWFSKGVLVAFGTDKQHQSGTYKRAQELGIAMLDAKDILSPDFGERLVQAIREHDLVSLKWKRV